MKEEFFGETIAVEKKPEVDFFALEEAVFRLAEKMNDTGFSRRLIERLVNEEYTSEDLEKMLKEAKAVVQGDFGNPQKKFSSGSREHIFHEHIENGVETQIIEMVKQAIENTDSFVGSGSVSAVVESKINNKICLKFINNILEYSESNDIEEESRLQSKAANLNVNGVRVPKPYYYVMNENGHILAMENLSAFSIEQVIKGVEKTPESFNIKKFFKLTREFIRKMHLEAGVIHLDIHRGNVMIDRETGLPYIIDFGKAKEVPESWKSNPVYIDNTAMANDLKAVDELEKEFKECLTKPRR